MKFDILRRAGIHDGDFAAITNVSRTTVSLWVNGHANPHRLHEKRIALVLAAVKSAVESKDLPLKEALKRDVRVRKIGAILATHVRRLSATKK